MVLRHPGYSRGALGAGPEVGAASPGVTGLEQCPRGGPECTGMEMILRGSQVGGMSSGVPSHGDGPWCPGGRGVSSEVPGVGLCPQGSGHTEMEVGVRDAGVPRGLSHEAGAESSAVPGAGVSSGIPSHRDGADSSGVPAVRGCVLGGPVTQGWSCVLGGPGHMGMELILWGSQVWREWVSSGALSAGLPPQGSRTRSTSTVPCYRAPEQGPQGRHGVPRSGGLSGGWPLARGPRQGPGGSDERGGGGVGARASLRQGSDGCSEASRRRVRRWPPRCVTPG